MGKWRAHTAQELGLRLCAALLFENASGKHLEVMHFTWHLHHHQGLVDWSTQLFAQGPFPSKSGGAVAAAREQRWSQARLIKRSGFLLMHFLVAKKTSAKNSVIFGCNLSQNVNVLSLQHDKKSWKWVAKNSARLSFTGKILDVSITQPKSHKARVTFI